MTTNFINAIEEDRQIQNGIRNVIPYHFSPKFEKYPMHKFIDKNHSFATNIQPFTSQKKDFSLLRNDMNITVPQKLTPIHIKPLAKEYSLDRHFNIEKFNMINRIPDAYFQYRMQGKTDSDLRLAALQKDTGTNNVFNNLIENAETGESIEDMDVNLKKVLKELKKNKTEKTEKMTNDGADPNDLTIVNNIFQDDDDDDDDDNAIEETDEAVLYEYHKVLMTQYTLDEREDIRRRLKEKPYPAQNMGESAELFIKRIVRNLKAKKKRIQKASDEYDKKYSIKSDVKKEEIKDEKTTPYGTLDIRQFGDNNKISEDDETRLHL